MKLKTQHLAPSVHYASNNKMEESFSLEATTSVLDDDLISTRGEGNSKR